MSCKLFKKKKKTSLQEACKEFNNLKYKHYLSYDMKGNLIAIDFIKTPKSKEGLVKNISINIKTKSYACYYGVCNVAEVTKKEHELIHVILDLI